MPKQKFLDLVGVGLRASVLSVIVFIIFSFTDIASSIKEQYAPQTIYLMGAVVLVAALYIKGYFLTKYKKFVYLGQNG